MMTINGLKFTELPAFCGGCPALLIGGRDTRGMCMFFEKRKNRWDTVPNRCKQLFVKGFALGGDLVIVLKND